LKEESLDYLSKDLLSILEILDIFQTNLFLDHYLEMTEALTISSIAKTKFLKYYLKDSKIPLINSNKLYNFIYAGYYGGITEVYKPYGINLKYYDVNSLYPYNALKPMPGSECYFIESFTGQALDLDILFGIFKAEVITNNLYLGLLPIKIKLGLILPNGSYEGTWTSVELQYAKKQGYNIKVLKGYQFNKVENVFYNYVNELSLQKDKLKGSQR